MNPFLLKRPCSLCPFRTDCLPGWLGSERAEEIAESITTLDQNFHCHETTGAKGPRAKTLQHCAGALIMLEHMESPNQMMRIAERLGVYDRRALHMDAPVFTDADEFIKHHE